MSVPQQHVDQKGQDLARNIDRVSMGNPCLRFLLPLLCISTDMTKRATANLNKLITQAPTLIKEARFQNIYNRFLF